MYTKIYIVHSPRTKGGCSGKNKINNKQLVNTLSMVLIEIKCNIFQSCFMTRAV